MPHTRRRLPLLLAGALVAVPTLAACGGNGLRTASSGTAGTPTATVTPSAVPSPTGSATPSPSGSLTPTPTPTVSSGPGLCPATALRVGWTESQGGAAAGSDYILLTFKNASQRTCYLAGHPGVSFVGRGEGIQLGQPAVRSGTVRTVVLAPGKSTSALLQIAEAGNYDAATCKPTTADGFRVYPPGSYASVFVSYRAQACQGDVGSSVGSPQLQVWPVGHSG